MDRISLYNHDYGAYLRHSSLRAGFDVYCGPSVVEAADSDRDDQTNDRQEVERREDELEETLSDELDNAAWTQRGSASSRGHDESYRGGAKDELFNGGRVGVPVGLRRRASAGDEDEETVSSGGNGGSGGGDGEDGGDKGLEKSNSSATHQPRTPSITTEGYPTTRLQNSIYPCEWPFCKAPVREFARNEGWRAHMNEYA